MRPIARSSSLTITSVWRTLPEGRVRGMTAGRAPARGHGQGQESEDERAERPCARLDRNTARARRARRVNRPLRRARQVTAPSALTTASRPIQSRTGLRSVQGRAAAAAPPAPPPGRGGRPRLARAANSAGSPAVRARSYDGARQPGIAVPQAVRCARPRLEGEPLDGHETRSPRGRRAGGRRDCGCAAAARARGRSRPAAGSPASRRPRRSGRSRTRPR